MKALTQTDFHFEGQKSVYHGKVRDVYDINDDVIVMVATDRISAFDVVLPKGIPFKGQVLNQIAAKFLDATTDICPNWKLATPDPMVTVGLKCEGFRVEMIIRSILTGSAWRAYKEGCREICGVKLPEGMKENQRFPEPIITPTTKADEGHDLNISKEEIIAQGIVSAEDYAVMEDYTRRIFQRGQEMAEKRGLSVSSYVACRAYDAASEDKRNEVSAPAAAEKRSPPFSCRKGGDRLRMLISDSEKGEAFP